jgi:hypothetical protein
MDTEYSLLIERFDELVEQEMLAFGLNPDSETDRAIYYQARIAQLKAREH